MRSFLYILMVALLAVSCSSTQEISKSNLSDLYRRGNRLIEPEYSVYHKSNDTTEISFRINTENLMYTKSNSTDQYDGKIKVYYLLYKAFESNELIDSASTIISDITDVPNKGIIYGKLDVKVSYPNHYLMKIVAIDQNRKQDVINYIEINKSNYYNRQNFKVVSLENNQPIFRNYVMKGESVKVTYNNLLGKKRLNRHFYTRDFEVAPPPFSVYNPRPFNYATNGESTIVLNDANTFEFTPDLKGFYHFLPDSNSNDGLTLYQYAEGFPEINELDELISALRFITSKKEFKEMRSNEAKKKVLDDFWLKIAHNQVRARELIRSYYNRVQNANYYFSSFKEGWKTDRGIIYIVFGPPSIVYKSSGGESWIYGEQNNYLSVTFNFSKANNPFSNNDFQLQRSPIFKNQWYRSVDAWRQGRISTLEY